METTYRNPPPDPAWVVDRTREIPAFLPSGGRLVFGVTHLPEGPRAAVVICSSIGPEQVTNYRNEVLAARALAASGVAVQRLHYRGTGHSDDGDPTVGTMVEDVVAAAGRLREIAGVQPSALLGTRWGALVAASAADAIAADRLVLWEPVLDPRQAFRELFRVRASYELRQWKARSRNAETIQADLETTGFIDVLGYALTRRFYDDALPRSLLAALASRPRRLLVIRLGSTASAAAGLARFVAEAEAAGHTVELVDLPQAPVWYFVDQRFREVEELVGRTVRWLAEG